MTHPLLRPLAAGLAAATLVAAPAAGRPSAATAARSAFRLTVTTVHIDGNGFGQAAGRCGAAQDCAVGASLTATVPTGRSGRRRIVAGSLSGTVVAGHSGRLNVFLLGAGKKYVSQLHRLRVSVTGTVRSGGAIGRLSGTVTLVRG